LLQSMGWQQDFLCRCLGDCIFGDSLDVEAGDLHVDSPLSAPPSGRSWFSYVRYNRTYKKKEMQEVLREHPDLASISAVGAIKRLSAIGKQYAEENVKIEHLV